MGFSEGDGEDEVVEVGVKDRSGDVEGDGEGC